MIIAIATEGTEVAQHFGHCEQFTLYNQATEEVIPLTNPVHQPGMLPGYLKQNRVDVIIAGGMGERAKLLFNQLGISVYVGIQSSVGEAIELFKKGQLNSNDVFCQHQDHGPDHNCHREG